MDAALGSVSIYATLKCGKLLKKLIWNEEYPIIICSCIQI